MTVSFFRRNARSVSWSLLLCFLADWSGNTVWALTSGPSQPETQQFAPAGMDNMVDPFTGDFSYNIPLMDVGGYPINLNYASGITPDAEASWVGLGWNLNVGAINRSVRGLPDDFAGDEVVKDFNVKPNQTYGVTATGGVSFVGFKLENLKLGLNNSANFFYNNYNGFGLSNSIGLSVSGGAQNKDGLTGSLGLNMSIGSESGLEVTPTFGLKRKQTSGNTETTLDASLAFPFSTREGLKGMTLSGSYGLNYQKINTVKVGDRNLSYSAGHVVGGINNSAFMGFASPTYTPFMEHDMYNVNASANIAGGLSTPGPEVNIGVGAYYSGQFLKDTRRASPAYGYMYSGYSSSGRKLLDYNREKDAGYNQFTTNLALTNFTYDIFSVSGQGIGGTYRLYRGDVGSVHDPEVSNKGYSPGLGFTFDFGGAPSSMLGFDLEFNYSQSSSGKWTEERTHINRFRNEKTNGLDSIGSEMAYFKRIGDMAPETDMGFFNSALQDDGTVRHELKKSVSALADGRTSGKYVVLRKNETTGAIERTTPTIPVSNNKRSSRSTRNTAFTTLTTQEASQSAVLSIENHERNNFNWQYRSDNDRSVLTDNTDRGYKKNIIPRTANGRKNHHLSEARVTDENGTRYIYGIPAYNTVQEEVTFAIAENAGNAATGLANYTPGDDDSKGNKQGLDHYYNKVSTPPFAHSYLLTCILSADYVDRDGIPGPSEGDLGTYTKFNYTRVIEQFKWRTPFSVTTGVASYSEGMTTTHDDDKANYIYGEKEIWYLHSIETRTHVAEFYLKDRLDARGTASRHGGVGEDAQQCLEKIVLYSKPDKWNSKAEPIKVVHFEYDYSLCPGTLNSVSYEDPVTHEVTNPDQGKLTLKKVWFTYGNSQKGVLNPYVFNYAQGLDGDYDEDLNPAYSFKNYDRWGNYKPDNTDGRRNAEFPYAVQEKEAADQHSAVYALSSIQTPTGGTLRVYYESDDYGYVQNKQAMRMFGVIGMSSSASDADSDNFNKLYQGDTPNGRLYAIIDLGEEGFNPSAMGISLDHQQAFRKAYLSGIDLMYYKFYIRVLNQVDREEYVPGYAAIDASQSQLLSSHTTEDAFGNTVYHRAVIKLNSVPAKTGKSGSRDVNPIVRSGWMYARLNLSRELMGSANAEEGAFKQMVGALLAQQQNIFQLITGFVNKMLIDGNSREFQPSKSFVRLNEPDKIKLGGGHRVKALVMTDNWGLMRSSKEVAGSLADKQTSYYGQSYDYSMMEDGLRISSGVAAYEPMLGGEENPFRRPVFVREKVPLAPAKEYYLEEPFGESFFPAPVVGYRKVTVTPLKLTGEVTSLAFLTGNGTGRVEHEFYTAYDFPSVTRRTDLQTYRHKPNILLKFMKVDSKDLVTCSQGYSVELNDMHGKQKAQRVYPEAYQEDPGPLAFNVLQSVKPISEVEYRYKLNSDGSLNNRVTYIRPDLSTVPAEEAPELGVDVDIVQDERYSESSTIGGGAHVTLKWIQLVFLPIMLPPVYPQINNEKTRFRSLVTTKVINKYGILESTTAKDNGASITTRNLAWDATTGKVLLTQVQNEFHDPIYQFTYPAHWAYDRLQLAAGNEGLVFTSGSFNALLAAGALRDGDEVYLEGNTNKQGYVNGSALVSAQGLPAGSYVKAKVIRSGARNMATVPIGSVTTLSNPLQEGQDHLVFEKVLNAGASEYQEEWKRFCNCGTYESDPLRTTNPYLLGTKGNARPVRSWTYLTERTQSQLNNDLNIRKDGYFKDYTPYWVVSGNRLVPVTDVATTRWQYVTEIKNYNPVGMEIENQDALKRSSMAQFGYGRNLPVATSNNSQYKESGFDGFEDYKFGDCEDDHFSWRQHGSHVSENEAHTGRQSIKVEGGQNLSIRKVIQACE